MVRMKEGKMLKCCNNCKHQGRDVICGGFFCFKQRAHIYNNADELGCEYWSAGIFNRLFPYRKPSVLVGGCAPSLLGSRPTSPKAQGD